MKTFLNFLSESRTSAASEQAKKRNLKSDGHGGWLDTRGNFVARTVDGKLKFMSKREAHGEEEGGKRSSAQPQPKANPRAAAQPQTSSKKAKSTEGESSEGSGEAVITICFGRFNPPTVGHEKLLKAASKASSGGDLKIYPSRSHDPKKNPIDPDMKISYMKKMFPDFKDQIINDDEMKTIFDVLVTSNEMGYTHVRIVVGSDRVSEFDNLAQKYNGELYDFEMIEVISAGMRDSDADGVEGMSASKMRAAVVNDDFDTFRKGTPKTLDDGDTRILFDATRTGMKIKKTAKESYNIWEIAPRHDQKSLRNNYLNNIIFKMGDIVESLTTGLVGKIIRRGTNHLICVTEENYMFKSWVRDVNETTEQPMKNVPKRDRPSIRKRGKNLFKKDLTGDVYNANEHYSEVHMSRKKRDEDHPNTLVGTDGYRKNAMKMTGTTSIRNFINKYKKK